MRFHFNVHDGFTRPDREGIELPDLLSARREAVRRAGSILEDNADRVQLGEVWLMEVTDNRGHVVLQFDFQVKDSLTSPPLQRRKL